MTQLLNDVELCRACRAGQRDAFRRVVERYQGLVTSITYSATGDTPISEDLAQDTFLQAWRKIGTLREPEKLAGWLCAIARNRVRDWLRRRRNDVNRNTVELVDTTTPIEDQRPDTRLEHEDETAIVWRAIESIPNDYREVLVLHYREQSGMAEIAEALDISEAAVRQRLSRARAMVRQEVAGVVERGLRRTRPSQAFTVGVMAALPAFIPTTASAAIGGSAAAKSSGALMSLGLFIGPVLGLLGGLYGTWLSVKHTDSTTERRFMVRYAWVVWLVIIVFLAALMLVSELLRERLDPPAYILTMSVVILLYLGFLIPAVLWGNKRQRAIRQEQGSSDLRLVTRRVWSTPRGIYVVLGITVFGSMAWMIVFATLAGDWLTAGLVTATALGVVVLSASIIGRYGLRATRAVLCGLTGVICGVTGLVLNTRLYAWIAQESGRTVSEVQADLPPWTLTVLTISAFVVAMTVVNLSLVSNRRDISNQPR